MTTATTFTSDEQRFLVDTAVEAVRSRLEGRTFGGFATPQSLGLGVDAQVRRPGASFVTLRGGRRLLGCVGSVAPVRPLAEDVAANALNAAFADPRLPALTAEEFASMEVKISVLGPLERIEVSSRDDLCAAIVPGEDGLLIAAGAHRGTFLPSVWEQVGSPEEFLAMLWSKAGLRPGVWPRNLSVERYHTVEFGEPGPRPPIAGF